MEALSQTETALKRSQIFKTEKKKHLSLVLEIILSLE